MAKCGPLSDTHKQRNPTSRPDVTREISVEPQKGLMSSKSFLKMIFTSTEFVITDKADATRWPSTGHLPSALKKAHRFVTSELPDHLYISLRLCASSPVCNRYLRFTYGATPADFFAAESYTGKI